MFLGLVDIVNPWVVLVILLWSIVWKGLALWVSARRTEKWWFIALLVLNTAGILEIIYLFWFTKHRFAVGSKSGTGLAKRKVPGLAPPFSTHQSREEQLSDKSPYEDNEKESINFIAEEDTEKESPERTQQDKHDTDDPAPP